MQSHRLLRRLREPEPVCSSQVAEVLTVHQFLHWVFSANGDTSGHGPRDPICLSAQYRDDLVCVDTLGYGDKHRPIGLHFNAQRGAPWPDFNRDVPLRGQADVKDGLFQRRAHSLLLSRASDSETRLSPA